MNTIEMVDIPAGTFLMGSLEEEANSYNDERPQHEVSVPQFFMGKTSVTQTQWRVVAAMEQVDRELKADPSRFKGDSLPVDSVNWHEAMEFCARLAKHTGRYYTLPSEAQWEYACRAGTQTPFHFGETITAKVANYNAGVVYGLGLEGEYRQKTTDVGSFPANAWGLYDMHGNVLEWCLDHWHPSYKGAPIDGSAWVTDGDEGLRMLRGGSWYNIPRNCRSASRNWESRAHRNFFAGFRSEERRVGKECPM
jgi:formylglycine-generating enzyme required for sulfatase activity